ncbi:putative uncharacterized protein DDB_G0282133 [Vanessa cardui]|uniref:putative uncharacterized protein DDB_G0282133 n=1 Tax=Vanessa cardui TaxID=171605 RepID=UPI001F148A94|nr:putative uncharacterized protein DDB_G0282133 [Vanessa cardui]
MKRTYTSNNLFSSFIINPYELINRNIGNPNLIDHVPLNANERKPTVQIIEIHSDETESEQQNSHNRNNDKVQNDINTREMRRLEHGDYIFDNSNSEDNEYLNQTFNSHCGMDDEDERSLYNKIKCLTIINNNINSNSSLDTEQSDDIEVIEFEDTLYDGVIWNCNNSYKIFECSDICKEEQYKWLFSKNISIENDNEQSSSTSNSNNSTTTDDDDLTKNRSRVPTPIFNFIPKLNLPSSPLPTLTEVAEPNKQSLSDITETSSNYSSFLRKSMNSWLEDGSGESKCDRATPKNTKSKLSTLSQRERRRSKIADLIDNKLESYQQNVYCEPKITVHEHTASHISSLENTENDLNLNNTNVTITISEDVNDELNATELEKVEIKLDTPIKSRTKVTSDPVEKLEGNWTGDSNDKITDVYDCDLNTIDSTVDSRGTKNLSNGESNANESVKVTSKLANRSRTNPTASNIPSLHLSFESDVDEDKSCFKRVLKFILCCK